MIAWLLDCLELFFQLVTLPSHTTSDNEENTKKTCQETCSSERDEAEHF
jgi:hypothetical protein